MLTFEKLRQDHLQLMRLSEELKRLIGAKERPGSVELFALRTKFVSALIRHLKEEDWVVYPTLLQSLHPVTRQTARDLQEEMGSLADAFRAYADQWTTGAIERDWPSYRQETLTVLSALERRISREDGHLYTPAMTGEVRPY